MKQDKQVFLRTLVKAFLVFIGVLNTSFYSSGLFAEAWELKPTVVLEERYHDNLYILSGNSASSSFESLMKGVLAFRRLSETTNIEGRLHANLSNISTNQQYFTLTSFKKFERATFGLDGSYRRDNTTRTIETDQELDVEVQQVNDVDEGLSEIDIVRNTLKLEPKWSYQYNERIEVNLGFSFNNVSYENNSVGTSLYDFQQQGITTSFSRNLSKRDILITAFNFSRYDYDDVGTTGDSSKVTLSYRSSISELTRNSISVGIRRSNLKTTSTDETNIGFLVHMVMDSKMERGHFSASAQRSLEPSGSGNLIEISELGVKLRYKIKERLFARVKVRGTENNPVSNDTGTKRYFFQLSPQLIWKISRWWAIGAGYMYQRREQLDGPNDGDNNMVFVNLRYSKAITLN